MCSIDFKCIKIVICRSIITANIATNNKATNKKFYNKLTKTSNMEFDPPGFDKPKEPPGFGPPGDSSTVESPQMEAETLNPDSSKETREKGSEILTSSGSETGRQEPQRSPTKIIGSDTGSEKSFQTASTTETSRNELAKEQAQKIKEQIAKQAQRAKTLQFLNPEEGSDAPAYSTRSHSRDATESPKKSGQTPEKTQSGLPMDSSSKETIEKQSKTGSKTSSKTKTVPSKARTTDKSGQKVDPIRLRRIEWIPNCNRTAFQYKKNTEKAKRRTTSRSNNRECSQWI